MPEPHDRLSTAFTELAVSLMPDIRLPGPAAAHQAVRLRRRRRVTIVAATVAAILVLPLAAFALLRGGPGNDPDIANTPATPSASPSASAEPPRLRVLADENAPAAPLVNAVVPIPSFGQGATGCPTGDTRYTDSSWQGAMLLADPPIYIRSGIAEVGIADVNGDGSRDWIAHVTCTFGLIQGSSRSQLVAYADNGAGSYTLIGQVVLTDGNSGLTAAEVSADGTVRAIVSGPYEPAGAITHEWHTYRWDGSSFVTVGSPEPIATPEPSNLTLTVSPSTVSGPQSVLTITVENAGSTSNDYLVLSLNANGPLSIRPEGFPKDLQPFGCDLPPGCRWLVRLESVAPGQSASGRFTVTGTTPGQSLTMDIHGWVPGPGSVDNLTDENRVAITFDN